MITVEGLPPSEYDFFLFYVGEAINVITLEATKIFHAEAVELSLPPGCEAVSMLVFAYRLIVVMLLLPGIFAAWVQFKRLLSGKDRILWR